MIKAEKPELYVQEKSPVVAGFLGILPGGGSFYTRQYGYGAANLALWPFSVAWDPFNGVGGARDLNYDATMMKVRKARKSAMKSIDDKLDTKEISEFDYRRKMKAIDEEYTFE